MKLPFVSRNTHEEVLQELYIKQKILENTYELLDESTERNLKLSEEKMELDKKYKGLVSYNRQVQIKAENLKTLLENSESREEQLLEINRGLREKIALFGIETFFRLKRHALKKKTVRLKKKKDKQLNDYLIEEVVAKIYE